MTLKTTEIEKIEFYFKEILENNGISCCDFAMYDIFKKWYRNKKRFIEAFGGLTYESSIDVSRMVGVDDPSEMNELSNIICRILNNYDDFTRISNFFSTNESTLFHNKTSERFDYYDKNHEILSIQPGRKIGKCIKELLFNTSEDLILEVQSVYSRFIQDKRLSKTSKVILSVHPLDFLSASENCHNWRSCHALNGDYAAGNIQFMCDDVTFMTYVADPDKEYDLSRFYDVCKWNSKKWRTFLFLKDDFLIAGNSYPYRSKDLLLTSSDAVLECGLLPATMKNCEWKKIYNIDGMASNIDTKFRNYNISASYYNDICCHSDYDPVFFANVWDIDEIPEIGFGEEFLCLRCGKSTAMEFYCEDCRYDLEEDRDDEDGYEEDEEWGEVEENAPEPEPEPVLWRDGLAINNDLIPSSIVDSYNEALLFEFQESSPILQSLRRLMSSFDDPSFFDDPVIIDSFPLSEGEYDPEPG